MKVRKTMTRNKSIFIVLCVAALALFSCGDLSEEPQQIPVPDPGQRFFEGGEHEYFGEDSPIVTIDPELGYRPDLELHDDVYWLPDEISKRKTFVDATTVKIPLESEYDPALGYEVGMVVIHKYWPIRHRILNVEVSKSHVTWTVDQAAYDEVIRHGDIYTYVPSDVPVPVAFDVLDPWMYEDREEQMRVIEEKYLDSELIEAMSTEESLAEARRLQKAHQARKMGLQTTQQSQIIPTIPTPGWCEGINDSSLSCDQVYDPTSEEYDACVERKRPCDEIYSDADLIQQCETAKANGDFDAPVLLVCDSFVRNNLDDLTPNGNPSMSPPTWDQDHCVASGRALSCDTVEYLITGNCNSDNFLPSLVSLGNLISSMFGSTYHSDDNGAIIDDTPMNTSDNVFRFRSETANFTNLRDDSNGPAAYVLIDSGSAKGYYRVEEVLNSTELRLRDASTTDADFAANLGPEVGLDFRIYQPTQYDEDTYERVLHQYYVPNSSGSDTLDVCPLLRPPNSPVSDQTYDDASSFICETLCKFDEQDTDRGGGASGSNWSAGVGICINSQTFGDDKCRANTALRINFDVTLDAAEFTDGTIPVSLTLTPVLTVAVGFKAKMRIRPFWAGVRVGFFAGVGIGAQTTLAFNEIAWRWEKSIDLLEKVGIQPEIPLPPVLFLTFSLRPVAELNLFAEASVGGSVTHNYFQERGFVICFAAKAGAGPGKGDWPSTGLYTGNEAADKCGIDPFPETEPINEIVTEDLGLEIRAGVELQLGLELVMKIGATVELGSIAYYPLVARITLGATIRPPRCTFDVIIAFGWRLRARLRIKISKFSITIWEGSLSGTYPVPRYYKTFPFAIGFLGCGEVNEPEPAAYEGNVCPPGPDPEDPDGNCLELPQFDGLDARCFVERCVLQDQMRVSLAWFDPRQDLDLYVRDPDGITYGGPEMERTSCGATCGDTCSEDGDCLDGWICEGGECMPEDQTYIENFVGDLGKTGTWEAWVVRRTSGSGIDQTALEDEVLFDLEFENAETAPARRATRGSVQGGEDGAPVKFLFCVGGECQ